MILKKIKNVINIIKKFKIEKNKEDNSYFCFIGSYSTYAENKIELLKNILKCIKLNIEL